MIEPNHTAPGLLSAEEEAAYRVLLHLGDGDAADVAAATGLDLVGTDVVLAALVARGLAVVRHGRHTPLAPELSLGTVLLRQQESLELARRAVAGLSAQYRASVARRDADRAVEVIIGGRTIRDRLRDLQDSAKEEILWFCRASPLAMQGSENTEEQAALERGVRYRAVYERDLLAQPGELDSVREGVGWGEEARVASTLPVRLAIVDRHTAICPLVHEEERELSEPTAAVIGRGQLLNALLDLFERHWAQATPLAAHDQTHDTAEIAEVGPAERLLLSLVVAGMPDKSLSTQLGVSRRTVQRRLTRLMELAGVDTRVGLAFEAGRRGWL